MAETKNPAKEAAAPATWDADDPIQKEVSSLLKGLQYDIMGIITLGTDGIMRSVTHDRKVLSAEPFRPELVQAFLKRLEGMGLDESNKSLKDADGTKTPKEKWFKPGDGILPPPLPQERWDEVKNDREENKAKLRKLIQERENYVDSSGVLD